MSKRRTIKPAANEHKAIGLAWGPDAINLARRFRAWWIPAADIIGVKSAANVRELLGEAAFLVTLTARPVILALEAYTLSEIDTLRGRVDFSLLWSCRNVAIALPRDRRRVGCAVRLPAVPS